MSLDYQDPTHRRQQEFLRAIQDRSGSRRATPGQPPESVSIADDASFGRAARLTKGLRGFYEMLRDSPVDSRLSDAHVQAATGWSRKSLQTYESKNKLASFMVRELDGRFRQLRGGPSLTEADVANALSQVTTEILQLSSGEIATTRRGKYVLNRKRGSGAIGHVWEGRSENGQAVAVKIVNPRPDLLDRTVFPDVKRRFRREAKNGRKLAHDALVTILDHGVHRRHPFMTMELANESLRDVLRRELRLSVGASSIVVLRCATALQYLHDNGCIHRDVKPENILHCDRGFVLGDLGIVRWDDLSGAFTSAGTITREAVQLGSWYYMAPEQLEDAHAVGTPSDVYALGVTWYELLSGFVPPPQAFAAGRVREACTVASINQLIRRMTSYDAFNRPGLDEVIKVATRHSATS